MIALVSRVAKRLKKDPIDLLPDWETEVNRALAANYNEQDSRAFIMAAKGFLTKQKIEFTVEDLLQTRGMQQRMTGGRLKVPKHANTTTPDGNQ